MATVCGSSPDEAHYRSAAPGLQSDMLQSSTSQDGKVIKVRMKTEGAISTIYSIMQIEIIRCNNEKAQKLLYSKNKRKKERPLMSLPCGQASHPLLQSDRPAMDVAPPTLNVSSTAKMSHNVPTLLPSRQSDVCPSAAEKRS